MNNRAVACKSLLKFTLVESKSLGKTIDLTNILQKPNIFKNSEKLIETTSYELLKIGFYNINNLKLNE